MSRHPALPYICAFALVVTFYVWTCTSDGLSWRFGEEQTDYYNLLVDGFLEGELHLKKEVSPELLRSPDPYDPAQRPPGSALHDATLFQGKYYIYYGVVPAVVLLLPFRMATGIDLPLALGVLIFVCAAYAATLGILHELRRRFFPHSSARLAFLLALGVGFASCAPVLLRRHSMYELPISSGQFFGLSAFFCLVRVMVQEKRRLTWLLASSLCWGLAIGSRPTYILAPACLILATGFLWRQQRTLHRGAIFAAALVPIACIGVGLALYNYFRFGDPLEFGVSYILSGVYEAKVQHFSLRYAPWNFFAYFFAAGEWGRYFPFYHFAEISLSRPEQHFGMDAPFGILRHVPFLWLSALVPVAFFRMTKREAEFRWVVAALALIGAAVGSVVLCFYAAMARYLGDFSPWLALLSCVGAFFLRDRVAALSPRWPAKFAAAGFGVMLMISVFTLTVFSTRIYDRVRQFNLAHYQAIARIANAPVHWFDAWRKRSGGPMVIRVTFPASANGGRREELLSTGWGRNKDRVYVVYPDAEHVQFGFEHSSGPLLLSEPIRADRAKPHDVRVSLGSLYPPESAPSYDALSRERRIALLRRLYLEIDGHVLFDRYQRFHDGGPDSVMIAGSQAGDFSGQIQGVHHEPREFAMAWAAQTSSRLAPAIKPDVDGTLRLNVRFPSNPSARAEPLVVSGETGRADFLAVEYLENNQLRFVLDHWGRAPYRSESISYAPGKAYRVEVRHPSYLSAIRPGRPADNTFGLRIDGVLVWECEPSFYPVEREDIFVGFNPIGGSTCSETFSGQVTGQSERER